MAPSDRRRTILAFGEALWDLLPDGAVLGGAPLNFAFRSTSLGERGIMVSRLGTDELGRRAEAQMLALGMDTGCIQHDAKHPTGKVLVRLDPQGIPDFTIVQDVAYDYIKPSAKLERLASHADCLCFGTLAQRSPVSRATLAGLLQGFRGRYLLLDVNLRRDCYSSESIRSSVAHAHILKMNETEAPEVARACGIEAESIPEIARGLLAAGRLEICVVTLGERGCFAMARAGEAVYEAGYQVRLVDTCGSGDAFTAAFLHRVLRGEPLRAACRAGNALGALVAGQSGATQPVSSRELDELIPAARRAQADVRFARYLAPG